MSSKLPYTTWEIQGGPIKKSKFQTTAISKDFEADIEIKRSTFFVQIYLISTKCSNHLNRTPELGLIFANNFISLILCDFLNVKHTGQKVRQVFSNCLRVHLLSAIATGCLSKLGTFGGQERTGADRCGKLWFVGVSLSWRTFS